MAKIHDKYPLVSLDSLIRRVSRALINLKTGLLEEFKPLDTPAFLITARKVFSRITWLLRDFLLRENLGSRPGVLIPSRSIKSFDCFSLPFTQN